MTEADAIKGLHQAARRREKAEQTRRDATADLQRFIREAQDAGVPVARIAREAGLSRQGVYDLLASRSS